jgi:hypothetical protein
LILRYWGQVLPGRLISGFLIFTRHMPLKVMIMRIFNTVTTFWVVMLQNRFYLKKIKRTQDVINFQSLWSRQSWDSIYLPLFFKLMESEIVMKWHVVSTTENCNCYCTEKYRALVTDKLCNVITLITWNKIIIFHYFDICVCIYDIIMPVHVCSYVHVCACMHIQACMQVHMLLTINDHLPVLFSVLYPMQLK